MNGNPRSTGERLRLARESTGLNQTDAAKLAGLSQSNLSALETDQDPLGPIRARRLALVYGVNVEELLPSIDSGPRESVVANVRRRLESTEAKLDVVLDHVSTLTEDVQRLRMRLAQLESEAKRPKQ